MKTLSLRNILFELEQLQQICSNKRYIEHFISSSTEYLNTNSKYIAAGISRLKVKYDRNDIIFLKHILNILNKQDLSSYVKNKLYNKPNFLKSTLMKFTDDIELINSISDEVLAILEQKEIENGSNQ